MVFRPHHLGAIGYMHLSNNNVKTTKRLQLSLNEIFSKKLHKNIAINIVKPEGGCGSLDFTRLDHWIH